MCPSPPAANDALPDPLKRQRGLGLVAAIFVITVMALLAVGLSNLVVTGQQTQGQEVLSVRAFLAAQSGAEIGASQVLLPDGPVCTPPAVNEPLVDSSLSLPGSGLSGCRVAVSCSSFTLTETATTYYRLVSEGRCGSEPDLAVRRLELGIQLPSP